MNGIDVDLHSRILLGLASVLADSRSKATTDELDRLLCRCPRVQLDIPDDTTILNRNDKTDVGMMTCRGQQALAALVAYCVKVPTEKPLEPLQRLLAYVRHLPAYDWEESSLMDGLPPSDLVTFSLVSGLLEIAYQRPEIYDKVINVLWSFAECIMKLMADADVDSMITFVLPSLAGLSRALQLSPHLFRPEQLLTLYRNTQALIKDQALDHIRQAITTCLDEHDPQAYTRRILAKYWEDGIPLSSNRVILDLLIILRNVAARVVVAAEPTPTIARETDDVNRRELHMTHAISDVWSELMSRAVTGARRSDSDLRKSMSGVYVMSLGYYDDLRKFAEERAKKWAPDTYMQEIMGTSLLVAALSSVYLNEVDDRLTNQISKCLFDVPHTTDSWVHIASLDAAVLLAVNFPQLNNSITQTICRFLTTPSPVFELEVGGKVKAKSSDDDTSNVRQFATLRLAQCVQIKSPSHLSREAISTLYALLNQITQFSDADDVAAIDGAPKVDQLTEAQKQQVCANALAAIVDMAVFLKDEDIMAQAFSMLVQRRKSLSAAATTSLISKLVDLALVGTLTLFTKIVDLFSFMSHEALVADNDKLFMAVLEAQLNLAKRISAQPDYYLTYQSCLLSLFVKNGNWVRQQTAVKKQESKVPLVAKLGKLLPVLRTLVEHSDHNAHHSPSEEMVSLFRDTWFHIILYGFVTEAIWTREWYDSIQIIAKKTPVLVMEGESTYIESELEHNLVLRKDNLSSSSLTDMRQKLTELLPLAAYDIKSFTWAQTVFTMAIYHTSVMRSRMGDCNYILGYFKNEGIHTCSLANCLNEIALRATETFTASAATRASAQTLLNEELRSQVAGLLELCCHRLKTVHLPAIRTTDRVVTSFPQVFADKTLVTLLLELVQLLWMSCEAEYRDEYCPVFDFTSQRANVTIELGDSFAYRREVFETLHKNARKWLRISLERAPLEVSGLLQDYLAEDPAMSLDINHVGRALAVQIGQSVTSSLSTSGFSPKIQSVALDDSSDFISGIASRQFYAGEISAAKQLCNDLRQTEIPLADDCGGHVLEDRIAAVLSSLKELLADTKKKNDVAKDRLYRTIYRAGAYLIALPKVNPELVRQVVCVPVQIFTPESLEVATAVWNWVMVERPAIETRLLVEILTMWNWAQRHRKGLFSPLLNSKHPFGTKMTYTPSDKAIRESNHRLACFLFTPHVTWIKFLSSRFYVVRHRSKHLVSLFVSRLQQSFHDAHLMSTHSLAGHARFKLLRLGLKVLQSTRLEALAEFKFRSSMYDAAFQWFSIPPQWHFGARKSLARMLQRALEDFHKALANDKVYLGHVVSTSPFNSSPSSSGIYTFLNGKTKDDVMRQFQLAQKLLSLFLESELRRLSVWCNPLSDSHETALLDTERTTTMNNVWKEMVRFAWETSPRLAVQMNVRFVHPSVHEELHSLIANNTLDVVDVPEALSLLLGERIQPNAKLDLKYLRYWAPVPAITAANYFLPDYGNHPLILQYAMRSLEYYPVDTVFFYIPQIVQALRFDEFGYVEKYIMEAGQVSQLFAHQIIWNMQANFYVDADKDCVKPDSLKPQLERIIDNLVKSFTDKDRAFYDCEFEFFGQVTAISGYLKEYIKYGQTEKKPLQKKRLDEELAKIKVEVGVYLPSNPEGRVVDILRTSGRPLQSHAKAPFMATFKIEKEKETVDPLTPAKMLHHEDEENEESTTLQVWQGAIFKVGDDCRQDVLALQLIAVFKNIFTSVGLDLYVYPYRVVATAPGRGVIDVIPRSISRDQLGREKVNSLYDYFVAKYGSSESIAFQRARTNFVQSVAAYSVISYLLQIKDRHNGNIMLDDDGHIIHIDFGFIFDIAPGGITFENAPFKLTAEMIQVMGGGPEEQSFKQFSELVIKAYLACRPYNRVIIQLVSLMLQSGLPCFRGETLRHMRTRFQTDVSERAAADFMIQRIKDSFGNSRTVLYDRFQKLTNGIPY